jgi:oxaloacetate decarboxylase (Na+ extruding) subunit alpha
MSEIKKKPVGITETILRDAHQSQIATRMTTEQMLPIIDKMDQVGYHSHPESLFYWPLHRQ